MRFLATTARVLLALAACWSLGAFSLATMLFCVEKAQDATLQTTFAALAVVGWLSWAMFGGYLAGGIVLRRIGS